MYKEILDLVLKTMEKNNYDILELETTTSINKRNEGYHFSIEQHLNGLIYSLLSNQRPWKGISENIENINKIFKNFDIDYVYNENPELFVNKLKKIKCGNRAIKKQMESLRYNIDMLKQIEKEYGTLDNYVTSKAPLDIAIELSTGKYKLKQIGFSLALEYLRNVGIDAIKPDIHICRILGKNKLALSNNDVATENEAINILSNFSKECNLSQSEIDSILWQFCSSGYCEICTKIPKCELCLVKSVCKYEKND